VNKTLPLHYNKLVTNNFTINNNIKYLICKECNKDYKNRSGLWKHNKICNFEKSIIDPPRTSSIITPSYITQDYNTAVTFPTFKAIGYTFVRWKDANNNTYTTINKLTGDITLYAEWQKKGTINFTELNRVYNGTRGSNPLPDRGVTSISIGKFRAESGQTGTNQIKLITHFQGKGL
jgi:uncharacterized repeat protein (TIGR02543 family)